MMCCRQATRWPFFTLVASLLLARGQAEDPCTEFTSFLVQIHWLAACPVAAAQWTAGGSLTCEMAGPLCPVTCGLCDAFYGPASCDESEVAENKRVLANALRDLKVYPESCEPPKTSGMPTLYVHRPSGNATHYQAYTGSYSTLAECDPCLVPGVQCDRCGAARSISIGFPAPVDLHGGFVQDSIFFLKRLEFLLLIKNSPVDFTDAPYVSGERFLQLRNLTYFFVQGAVHGDFPPFGELPITVARSVDNFFVGNLNNMYGSPDAVAVVHDGWRFPKVANYAFEDKLCNMQKLFLFDAAGSGVTGTLPKCMSQLSGITNMYLGGNHLRGTVDHLNLPGLIAMHMQENQFAGPLPPSIGLSTVLSRLKLNNNNFTGTIPSLSTEVLEFIDARFNSFSGSGTIQGSAANLLFSSNSFTELPAAWQELRGVRQLDLADNWISHWTPAGVNARGTITEGGNIASCGKPPLAPPFLWDDMELISISNNPLHGQDVQEVLGSFSYLPSLLSLDVSGCGLVKDLPIEGTLGMLIVYDAQSCATTTSAGFQSLYTLKAADNEITRLGGGPWQSIQQADFARNNLSYIHSAWIEGVNVPVVQDFRGNPNLRLPVLRPAEGTGCPLEDTVLRVDGSSYSASNGYGNSSECGTICTSRGKLAYVDGIANASSLCRCRSGWYGEGIACSLTGPGEWSAAGASTPTACPRHSSTTAGGATSPQDCLCDPGYYRAFSSEGEMQCLQCPDNHIRETSGGRSETDCLPCPRGRYSPGSEQTCIDCPLGAVAAGDAGSGCSTCEPGTYMQLVVGIATCTQCPFGTYQHEAGQTACIECEGEGNHTWEYNAVESRFVELAGARSASNCGCAVNRRPVGGECISCGEGPNEGLHCPGGLGEDVVYMLPGYYSDVPISVFRCWGDEERCPGDARPGEACADGREGLTCALCEEGKIPSDRGTCRTCTATSKVVLPFVLLCALACGVALYVAVDRRAGVIQNDSILLLATSTSLLVTSMQHIGVISGMSVEWMEPLKSILSALRLLTFDVEVVRLGCVARVDPLNVFAAKLSVIFVSIVVMLLIHIIVVALFHGGRFRKRYATLVGCVGAVMTVFYIAVVTTMAGPLQCEEHPNGKWTARSYQSVVCWDSAEHFNMVCMSVSALSIPAAYLSWVWWVVTQYPHRIRRGDMLFLKAYSFLFFRFKPECHWYILVNIFRSLSLSLTVIIPSPSIGVFVMQAVMFTSACVTLRMQPWRANDANYLDFAFAAAMLLMLSCAFFFLPEISDLTRRWVAWFCAMVILVSLFCTPVLVTFRLIRRRCCRRRTYAFFLCHHKAGAGAFTRYLKLMLADQLAAAAVKEVFVDADNLENLDALFSHVRDDSEVLVAIASRELYWRPWCVGELTTARLTNVKVIQLKMPDFVPLTEAFIAEYVEHVDITALVERSISLQLVQETLDWLRQLPCLIMPETITRFAVDALVKALLTRAPVTSDVRILPVSPSGKKAGMVICCDYTNLEAVSSALVLEKLLFTIMAQAEVDSAPQLLEETQDFPGVGKRCCMVLTGGCLEAPPFLARLAQAAEADATAIPVVAQESFRFPTREQALQLPVANASVEAVAAYILDMLKEIATAFLAQYASETVLRVSAKTIAGRLLKARKALVIGSQKSGLMNQPSDQPSPTGSFMRQGSIFHTRSGKNNGSSSPLRASISPRGEVNTAAYASHQSPEDGDAMKVDKDVISEAKEAKSLDVVNVIAWDSDQSEDEGSTYV